MKYFNAYFYSKAYHMLSLFRRIFLMLTFMLLSCPAFAADGTLGADNAAYFGITTILPPLMAIGLAFVTRNVILSLFFGTFTGTFMLAFKDGNALEAFINGFLRIGMEALGSLADSWNAGIVLQVLMIGALIALITRMGGVKAVAEGISKIAKGPRSTQIATWLMGLFIFFDDYANSLTVGPMMRPATDAMRISRERFSFIIDATAAPISGMALISTWVAYELGVIRSALGSIGVDYNAYGMFISSLPYRYYNIFILIFIVITSLMLRDFGLMHKAEVRARTTGEVLRKDSIPMSAETLSPMPMGKQSKSSIWYAVIPISVLIFGAFIGFYVNGYHAIMADGGEAVFENGKFAFTAIMEAFGASDASVVLFQAALFACVVAIIMGLTKKLFNIKEALDTVLTGIKSMNITVVILLLAWSLTGIIQELGTSIFLVNLLSQTISPWMLPAIIFVLGSIISFSTGTSYGTMGILMPLAVPLAWAIAPGHDYLVLNIGAVLTGAIFGDHCSPISDTTILSSMGAAVDHMDHVRTQMPYALTIGLVSITVYILAGLGMNVWFTLLIGVAIVFGIVRFVGKPAIE
jgi:Na+/H+ antiporter NhaC